MSSETLRSGSANLKSVFERDSFKSIQLVGSGDVNLSVKVWTTKYSCPAVIMSWSKGPACLTNVLQRFDEAREVSMLYDRAFLIVSRADIVARSMEGQRFPIKRMMLFMLSTNCVYCVSPVSIVAIVPTIARSCDPCDVACKCILPVVAEYCNSSLHNIVSFRALASISPGMEDSSSSAIPLVLSFRKRTNNMYIFIGNKTLNDWQHNNKNIICKNCQRTIRSIAGVSGAFFCILFQRMFLLTLVNSLTTLPADDLYKDLLKGNFQNLQTAWHEHPPPKRVQTAGCVRKKPKRSEKLKKRQAREAHHARTCTHTHTHTRTHTHVAPRNLCPEGPRSQSSPLHTWASRACARTHTHTLASACDANDHSKKTKGRRWERNSADKAQWTKSIDQQLQN